MANPPDQDRGRTLEEIRSQWLELGTACVETSERERERCEWAVRSAIEAVGGETHSFLSLWVPSPMAGVLAAASIRGGLGDPMGARIKEHLAAGLTRAVPGAQRVRREVDATVQRARDAVHAQVAAELLARGPQWEQMARDMGNYAWDRVWQVIGDPVYTNCGFDERAHESIERLEENLEPWSDDMMEGQFGAGAMAQLDAMHLEGGVDVSEYEGIRRLAVRCSWWWATDSAAVLCEHPVRFEVSGEHVTVEFRDGWTVRT
ncbi:MULTISPECIES: hypothetical protein [unclassified Mycobacterium]|uniref:hypothetical protein n=1 Tax=unclassified Mycobacterium TaxID=2642494 RepID=UPI0029C735D1|nr:MULTISPECIES: hypothetical protein [unclassified Mycobacterium]